MQKTREDMLTLWILFCRMTEKWDTLFTFYARDREDAERQAEEILREHPYEQLELKEYPHGFRMVMTHLPGTIWLFPKLSVPGCYRWVEISF